MRQAFSIAMSEAFFGDNEQDDEELREMEQIFIDLVGRRKQEGDIYCRN